MTILILNYCLNNVCFQKLKLVIKLLLITSVIILSGCGQKGPLYKPNTVSQQDNGVKFSIKKQLIINRTLSTNFIPSTIQVTSPRSVC